jgi:hypothetical protein
LRLENLKNIFITGSLTKMYSLFSALFRNSFGLVDNVNREHARVQLLRQQIRHGVIQRGIHDAILNGFITRDIPKWEKDEHWAICLGDEEEQFQATNCRICGEYKFPYPNDNERLRCYCGNDMNRSEECDSGSDSDNYGLARMVMATVL